MHVKSFPVQFKEGSSEAEERILEGYASIWDVVDLYGDRVLKGAFSSSLKERLPNNRVKAFFDHHSPVGVVLDAKEDERGLWVKAKIAATQLGDDLLELVRLGALDSMSIGYDLVQGKGKNAPNDHGGFDLDEIKLYEVSYVGMPANEEAVLTGMKSMREEQAAIRAELAQLKATDRSNMYTKAASGDTDLPIASGDASWDGDAAEQAVAKWATNEDGELDVTKFGKAFFWKAEGAEKQGDFKLGFATVSDGELKAVPAGVKAAAASIQGARATPDIPESDVDGVKAKIATYYNRMDLGSPPWADDSSESGSSESGSSEEGKASEETEEVDHSDERIAEAIEKVVTDLGDVARMLRERGGGSGEPPETEETSEKTMEDFRRELAEFKSL